MMGQTRLKKFKGKRGPRFLAEDHPAVVNMTTIFPTRIFAPDQVKRVLKSGYNSRKIGRVVTKGRWKGMPIFTLTLTERETCPTSCREWRSCYGHSMPYAERIAPGPDLERALGIELKALQVFNPNGFVVRLHVLGDFYSIEYIEKWFSWLRQFPAMRIMGFTAHPRYSLMGKMLAQPLWSRWAMRFSGSTAERGAITIGADEAMPVGTLPCPAQDKSAPDKHCGNCSLCWASEKPIAFRRH